MLLPGGLIVVGGRRWPGRRSTRPVGALLLREVQNYGWPWPGMLIVLLGLVTLASVAVPFGRGMWRQLVLGRPWGDRPIPDAMFYVVGPLAILLSLLPFAVLFTRLLVEVREDGMLIELVRFKGPQVILRDEVRSTTLAHIGPFGWGATRHGRRLVYRLAGSEGVEIELANGKKVVIASDRPRTLLEAIRSMSEGVPRP